ncbi:MAG: DUF1517 domain-containing protein [Archangium sp.]|nr:DUF1517 domain-containing protein [Archangium sp.]
MNDDLTPDELLATGAFGLCCCLLAAAGLVAVVIWLMRKGPAPSAPAHQPPPPGAPFAPAAEFHLSVIALAFDGFFRQQVEAMLTAPTTLTDPVGVRVELVQRAARALLGVAVQWRLFGYGEKDLNDLTAAQQSYASALTDFRARSGAAGDGGSLCVLTLVLCTRGRRLGVDRLDTRQQINELLSDRLKLDAGALLGAELVWAPASGGLSEPLIRERFPEMHAIAL